jgi:hypothetical protein
MSRKALRSIRGISGIYLFDQPNILAQQLRTLVHFTAFLYQYDIITISYVNRNSTSDILNTMDEPTTSVLLRIPASLKARLAALAEREHRSLNRQIEFLLDQAVRSDSTEQKRGTSRQTGEGAKHGP